MIGNSKFEERFEDKFLIKKNYFNNNINFIFSQNSIDAIHDENCINNIYFDTLNYECYFNHIEGSLDRSKIRLRWYTQSKYNPGKFFLEYKKRINKKSIKIKKEMPINNLSEISNINLVKLLNDLLEDYQIKERYIKVWPVLFNKYKRNYFINNKNKERLTLDSELFFSKCFDNYQFNYFQKTDIKLIEHKYDTKIGKTKLLKNNIEKFNRVNFSKYIFGFKLLKNQYIDSIY